MRQKRDDDDACVFVSTMRMMMSACACVCVWLHLQKATTRRAATTFRTVSGSYRNTRINLATTPATRRCKLHEQLGSLAQTATYTAAAAPRPLLLLLLLSAATGFVCVCVIPVAADWSDNGKPHAQWAVLSEASVRARVCVCVAHYLRERVFKCASSVCVCVCARESEADERRVLASVSPDKYHWKFNYVLIMRAYRSLCALFYVSKGFSVRLCVSARVGEWEWEHVLSPAHTHGLKTVSTCLR